MKKILWLLLFLMILFIGAVYFSVSGKSEENTAVILNTQDLETVNFRKHDSVLIAASTLYRGNFLKEAMQGENYREAWSTPVKIPVVFLDTLHGGMIIIKEGGGSQTTSLKLKSSDGVMYSLRSINKDPDSHVPEIARKLGLENIITDAISASHPYGAVAAAALAEAAGVLHTYPRPVFVPKQKFLGDFNEKYGNRLFLLELETEGEVNPTPVEGVKELVETDDLQELKMELGARLQIDKSEYIKSRLFDLLIGDWDRHAKQYGWVLVEKDSMLLAHPLPGDRDNVFFKLQGVIPNILSHKSIEPLVRPFEKEIDHMPGLVYSNDRYFLYDTPEEIFIKEAEDLQKMLTDKKIYAALRTWPKAFYELDGPEIAEKIAHRRDNLVAHAVEFRNLIQEKGVLEEPLKGSEDLDLSPELEKCFECE